ncbi:MAG: hypothetical protein LBF60_05665, partial [Treponema sp.]|nr:hypothetical protein [Treponema sp.]
SRANRILGGLINHTFKINFYSALAAFLFNLPPARGGGGYFTPPRINQYKNDPFGVKKIEAAYAAATLALTGAAIASRSALAVAETSAMTGAASASVSGGGVARNMNVSSG